MSRRAIENHFWDEGALVNEKPRVADLNGKAVAVGGTDAPRAATACIRGPIRDQ